LRRVYLDVTYRVAFTKRFESGGHASALNPTVALDAMLADGILAEKRLVERFEPAAKHSQETMDEDDAFLGSSAAEIWEYEIVDSRCDEFEAAMGRAGRILEFEVIDETPTLAEDLTDTSAAQAAEDREEERNNESTVADPERQSDAITSRGSGVRAGDDGPAGMPTADPSAGRLNVGSVIADIQETVQEESSGEIDELRIEKARDPRLGLTNRGNKRLADWAADTGPARNPERGIESEKPSDYGSTLRPANGKR
jgi:hypothetical protein